MTVTEVAQSIHRTPRYVRALIKSKTLRAIRIGERGGYLIRPEWLDELLNVEGSRPRSHSQEYYLRRAAAAVAIVGYGPPGVPADL